MAKKYWTFKGQKIPVRKSNIKRKIGENTQFNKVVRLTGRVNKRINEINIKYGKESWATKKLLSRLDVKGINVVRGGRIKIPKNLPAQKLKLVESALNKFLGMKTSSVKGIENVIKKQKQNIKVSLSDETIEITDKEAETLYNFFEDDDFKIVTQYLTPSETWGLLEWAKTSHKTENQFINEVKNYVSFGNDTDMVKALSSLYNKYVSV